MVLFQKRARNLFDPASEKPYKLSRSKIEDFVKCPRCFYLDRRLGINRPSIPAFTLNSAVNHLLKKEFDLYRAKGEPHPIMKKNGVGAVCFRHPDLDTWRENFKGVRFHHEPTNFLITGAVDDLWQKPDGELIVVDYKATSKDGEVTLDDKWKESYKRQMEIYQWLLRKNGFKVSDTGYFVYANALRTLDQFNGNLVFDIRLIPYKGNSEWVEKVLMEAQQCLARSEPPECGEECEYCGSSHLCKELA